MKTAVLIPCYNESKTVQKVVEDYRRVFPHADIYVYDNNSSDHTDEIARRAGAIVRYEYKQGKGNVIRSMFREIEADCYIVTDGDDTYPAEDAKALEEIVLSGKADMAIGDRLSSTYFTENKRPFHNVGNVTVRNLINRIFKADVRDIMTGLRAFNRPFVKTFPITSKGFEIETEMTIFALEYNYKIEQVPIDYRDRPAGSESKLNTYSDGLKVIRTIFSLFCDIRPFTFFSLISLLLVIICAILFIPIMIEFFNTGLVSRSPTLIVLSGIAIVAMMNFFVGIVLLVLRKRSRQEFERSLTMLHYLMRLHPVDQERHD